MAELTIVPLGDAAAVALPDAIIQSIGLRIGDKVDVSVINQQLILRPVDDDSRRRRLAEITQEVFQKRGDAYRRLA